MSKITRALFAIVSLIAAPAPADDIEAYLGAGTSGAVPYIHLILDYRPSMFTTVCRYGPTDSCAPPFMSREAYDHLEVTHTAGDAVSRFEVFVAVLETLLEDELLRMCLCPWRFPISTMEPRFWRGIKRPVACTRGHRAGRP